MLSIRKVSHNYQARYTERLKEEVPNLLFFFFSKQIRETSKPEKEGLQNLRIAQSST